MLCTVYPRGQVVAEDYVRRSDVVLPPTPPGRDHLGRRCGGFGVHTLVELTVFGATAAANV
jgi:hypothetical protein